MPFSTTFSRGSILESLVKTIYYSKFQIHFSSSQWNSDMDGTQIWLLPNPGLQPKKHTCVKVCNTVYCKHRWSYFELFGSFFIFWDSKVSSCIFFQLPRWEDRVHKAASAKLAKVQLLSFHATVVRPHRQSHRSREDIFHQIHWSSWGKKKFQK